MISDLPKVVLHEHIEGSITPNIAKKLAAKYSVKLPEDFLYPIGSYDEQDFPDGRYNYDEHDFNSFIATYDTVASLVREPIDYYHVMKDFLTRNSKKGMVYCEMQISAFHLAFNSETRVIDTEIYYAIMNEIERAIEDIYQEFGTITRLHTCAVRHLPKEEFLQSIDFISKNHHRSITGFNIAGNEMAGNFSDFEIAHETADKLELGKSYHAGEICGPESVRDALSSGATRIGHGIASIDDNNLLEELIEKNVTLEISLTSNRILVPSLNHSLDKHPIRKLYDKGVRITINTDDAGLFGTDINKEYMIASNNFGFSRIELLDVTLCGIESAFLEDSYKLDLMKKVYAYFDVNDIEAMTRYIENCHNSKLRDRYIYRLSEIDKL